MICHITVRTAKLDETVEFYQWLLGLPIASELKTPGGRIVFLDDHETKFEILESKDAGPVNAEGLSVGFLVDSLEDKIAMLDSRNIAHSEVLSPGPGTRFLFFTDLNGCAIQLVEG